MFGGDEALAKAVNRFLVVGFYLLVLGFVVLAMRPSGQITGVRQAAGMLSVKVGEALLVLGALIDGSTMKIGRELRAHLPELRWLYSLGVILYWVHDTSPGCARTHRLIDRTYRLIDRPCRSPPGWWRRTGSGCSAAPCASSWR